MRILTEPTNSLVRQYTALLATEGIALEFKEEGLLAIARLASLVNERSSDIGARRLHTVMEKLLEPLSFDAPDMRAGQVVIDEALVHERLSELVDNIDVSNYIL